MSVHLKWGEIHPRTMLADLRPAATGADVYRRELAWREFYADVLHAGPSQRAGLLPAGVRRHGATTEPGEAFAAWTQGRPASRSSTPGCGSCAREGWMHNRVRMIVASLPGQGSAHRVAARRPALHALPGRRRPRLQPARLAVDGRHRDRCGAVLPGLQPDRGRARSSTPKGDYVRRGYPSYAASTAGICTSRGPRRAACRVAIRSGSSTMPRSASRPCGGTRRSDAR